MTRFGMIAMALVLGFLAELPVVAQGSSSVGPEVIVVLDASGSMGYPIDSRTRYDYARDAVSDLLDAFPEGERLGLVMMPGGCMSYADRLAPEPLQRSQQAVMAELVDLHRVDRADPVDIDADPPQTPIAATLQEAAGVFTPGAEARKIILVSDGEEGCATQPCEKARQLIGEGFEVTVDTVGFQISKTGAEQLRCISSATSGQHYDIKDAGQLSKTLRKATVGESFLLQYRTFIVLGAILLLGALLVWRRRQQKTDQDG